MRLLIIIIGILLILSIFGGIIFKKEDVGCASDSDCVAFGKDGDCNCGCYLKDNVPEKSEGKCFCAAPKSCKCEDGKCVPDKF